MTDRDETLGEPMVARTHARGRPVPPRALTAAVSRFSGAAWGVVGVTLAFIGLTYWWLTQDRSIPIYDAGSHLATAIEYRNLFSTGDLKPLGSLLYPPLAPLVGGAAALIGGVSVASPIIGANLVFVPLLTLGCYQTGRLLFGPRAGLLAAIFVLGSPLLIAQFHVFMLEAPETAVVAVSMWLLLASEDFSRTRVAGWAGLAVACGLLVKVQFPFIVAGIVLTALARGGWRHGRGLFTFAAIAFVIAAPWYLDHLSGLGMIAQLAGPTPQGAIPGNQPPTFSTTNLTWYLWSTLNTQLFAPLFAFLVAGAIWMVARVARDEDRRGPRLEFLIGGFVAWLATTLTPHHDLRYDMPLLPYLAILGTAWISYLPRAARLAAIVALGAAVAANTFAITFGVGGVAKVALASSLPATEDEPDRVVLYSNQGFLVAGPQRDGDVQGLLAALRREGVVTVRFSAGESAAPDFSAAGLRALAKITGLTPLETGRATDDSTADALIHRMIEPGAPPTCTRLSDGTGVWTVRFDSAIHRRTLYCPLRGEPFFDTDIRAQRWAAGS